MRRRPARLGCTDAFKKQGEADIVAQQTIADTLYIIYRGEIYSGEHSPAYRTFKPVSAQTCPRKRKGQLRPAGQLRAVGLSVLVESVGVRGVQALLARHCGGRSWQRIRRKIRELKPEERTGFRALAQLDEALKTFRPLRLENIWNRSA